jgi:outer membrane protein
MKKLLLASALSLSAAAFAQKVGVVDTNYVLSKLPAYQDAEKRLAEQIGKWQTELKIKQEAYDKKKAAFESEKVFLVGQQLKDKEKELDDLRKDISTVTNIRFGNTGEIYNLRGSLVKPFQDQIWNAIESVSKKAGLGIVLDKSNNISVIFMDKNFDYSEQVLAAVLKLSADAKATSPASPIDAVKDVVKEKAAEVKAAVTEAIKPAETKPTVTAPASNPAVRPASTLTTPASTKAAVTAPASNPAVKPVTTVTPAATTKPAVTAPTTTSAVKPATTVTPSTTKPVPMPSH